MLLFGLVIMILVLSQQLLAVHAYAGSYALDFDGTTDSVFVGRTVDIMGTPTWVTTKTVSLWLRPLGVYDCTPTFPGPGRCDAVLGDTPRWWGISRGVDFFGADRIWVWNWDGNPDAIGITYTVGEWMHVALVHGGGRLRAYKNGILVGDIASGATQQPGTGAPPDFYFGGFVEASTPYFFEGQLDELQIWNVARTADEIRRDMYRTLTGSEPGLRAYFRMTDGTGLTVTDDSGNGFNGTMRDGWPSCPSCPPPNGTYPLWVASGAFAGPRMALDFDGVDDFVDVVSDADTVIGTGWAGTKTAEVWVRPTTTGIVTNTAVQGDLIIGGTQWGISQANISSEDRLWLWNNDGDEDRIGLPYTVGEWTHLALVHDGGVLTVYQDGRAAGSITSGNTISDTVLTIGGRSVGNYFQGQLDELRLWNTARSAAQILANAYQTVAPDESGLAAYYRFDQQNQTGQTEVVDSSGNGHHATMTNMTPNGDWVASTAFNTWIGGDSQIWSSGGNWSRYATTDTRLGITRYPNSYSATVTMTTTILDAVLSPNADLVVDDTLTVNERLIGPGHVTVNGNLFNVSHMDVATVTVASGALLEVQNGGVLTVTEVLENNGTLRQTQPVSGSVASFFDTGAYGGVQIDSNGQNLGNTVVSIRGNQNCTNVPDETVRRCFDIAPELSPTIGISITFAFADDELPLVMDCNTLNVYHWNGSGWDVITPTVRTCSSPLSFITVEGVTDFSPFVLRSPNSPTAVTLHSFSMDTPVDAMQLAPIILFLMMITGFVMWQHSRRRAQSVR